jgi:nucleotide-binding universal stress UspA family protein
MVRGDSTSRMLYDNVLVSLSKDTPIEIIVEGGCRHLSENGELLLVFVIEIPSQLPYIYADTQVSGAKDLLDRGLQIAIKRNIKVSPLIISTRDFVSAIAETAVTYKSQLIVLGKRRRTLLEKVFLSDISVKLKKKTGIDVIVSIN